MRSQKSNATVVCLPCLPSTVYCLPCLILSATAAYAAPVAIADRAVDSVTLVSGEQVLGALAAPPADDMLTLYVSRDWLQKHQPKLYGKLTANDDDRRKQALQQYLDRLQVWLRRRAEPKLLNDFIERSIRDVQAQLDKLADAPGQFEPSQLLIVELPTAQVRRSFVQPQPVRRLLGLAWEARLADAEELSASEIKRQLNERDADVEHALPDLSGSFDIVPLTEGQWAAKVALIEFKILGKPRYQGTGGVLLRDDGDAARPPLGDLVGDLIQDQLGDALGDLLNPQAAANAGGGKPKQEAAVDKALASARDDGATGVRITYLDQSLTNRRVTVSDTFYARMPDDRWQPIWQQSSSVALDEAKEVGEDQLAADPQIAEIMTAIKGLGLDANNDLLKSALRFGGATQKAMETTEREFADFLLATTRRLIGPPIPLPASK